MTTRFDLIYFGHKYEIKCEEITINKFTNETGEFYQATLSVIELLSIPTEIRGIKSQTLTWDDEGVVNILSECEIIISEFPTEIVMNARHHTKYRSSESIKIARFRSRDIDNSKITDFML